MKIIMVDNFNRETVSDILICKDITSKILGDVMCSSLNEKHMHSDKFFLLKEDDYILFKDIRL